MANLYNATDVDSLVIRIENLTPTTERQWGKMNIDQMVVHCGLAMEMARGNQVIPRVFIGRIIGSLLKKKVLGSQPFGKNSPTDKSYIITGNYDLEAEKAKTIAAIRAFQTGGPVSCTTYPHPFFGHFTPDQWAVFQWKHLDHHLRQFGV